MPTMLCVYVCVCVCVINVCAICGHCKYPGSSHILYPKDSDGMHYSLYIMHNRVHIMHVHMYMYVYTY